jgi:hypothetical protein
MASVAKLDLKKELKHLYRPSSKRVVAVDVPEMQFAMIEGQIEPGKMPGDSPEFASAIAALFGISYTLKFMSKKRPVDPIDYTVMALEGLWTTPEGGADYATSDEWLWALMIMQPEHITQEMFADALAHLREKQLRDRKAKKVDDGQDDVTVTTDSAMLDRLRLKRFAEGLSIQIMHLGPYSEEPRTLEKMAAFASANGYVFHGRHHEIYLGDPKAAKQENLRTVLRHAVKKVEERSGE